MGEEREGRECRSRLTSRGGAEAGRSRGNVKTVKGRLRVQLNPRTKEKGKEIENSPPSSFQEVDAECPGTFPIIIPILDNPRVVGGTTSSNSPSHSPNFAELSPPEGNQTTTSLTTSLVEARLRTSILTSRTTAEVTSTGFG